MNLRGVKSRDRGNNLRGYRGKKGSKNLDSDFAESKEKNDENVSSLKAKVEKEETEEVKEEDFKSKFYYLAAEIENLKKRTQRERENLFKFGSEKILTSLLGVLDNLELTLSAIQGDEDKKVKNIFVGVDMVKTQFLDVLKSEGLTEVESTGKKFDPNFHEAVSQEKSEEKEDGEIVRELQKGYILNGRLLRASKVIVVKNN